MSKKLCEWDAISYKKNSTPQQTASLSMIDAYLFNGNEKILDLGCRDGKLSAYLAQNVSQGSVVGIDGSQNMIDLAKKHYQGVKNLNFTQGDVQTFDLNEEFDVITSFFCLMWPKNKATIFEKIHKHIKPGLSVLLIWYYDPDTT